MKASLGALGVVLVVVGGVWVGQGLGYIKGSFMTGQIMWTYIGAVVAIAGLALALWAARGIRRSA